MMQLQNIHSVFLIGIGGIGMSALARFFKAQGKFVSGYDRSATPLIKEMQTEGMEIHFQEDVSLIPAKFLETSKDNALVIYTPAVQAQHKQLVYLKNAGYTVQKRSQVLGWISKSFKTIAIAGTHGKTTTAAMIAHILRQSPLGCNAFLGGISSNYKTNFLSDTKSEFSVIEADEFDRSFLTLNPEVAVITSVDADHLDIYGEASEVLKSFQDFSKCIKPTGVLFHHADIKELAAKSKTVSYALRESIADLKGANVKVLNGFYHFDVIDASTKIEGIKLGLPGRHNVENALAAAGIAIHLGVENDVIKNALSTFLGVKRRFETHIHTKDITYIDDYAHHPTEIRACVESVKELYPTKRITAIFQPHLFSRTRDFAEDFAKSLSLLDEVILLEIYPAREEPIAGINSTMLLNSIICGNKSLMSKEEVVNYVRINRPEVLLTLGAGDIDQLVEPISKTLNQT